MDMKKNITRVMAILLAAVCLSCVSVKVTRTEINKKVDLSGSWNDTDSRLVAEEMINDCLSRPWVGAFSSGNGKLPVVILGTIMNRTSEHINARLFESNLEKSLINSGKVKFVAGKEERQELREEKQDQAQNASRATAKAQKVETGADFMLQGSINSVKDEVAGKYVILYQVNLELVDLTTNEKSWIGQKEIKKVVSRRAFGF